MVCIDEVEVFEPLFLLFIPNPFSYISPATPGEDIVQDWGTPNSHFSFPTEAEQELPAICNVGGKNGYSHFRALWREREELDGFSLEFTECSIFLTVGPDCTGKGIENKQNTAGV